MPAKFEVHVDTHAQNRALQNGASVELVYLVPTFSYVTLYLVLPCGLFD